MYAMTLVSIPQYVFMLIQFIHPENKWTSGAIKALTVGQPLWLVVYLVMLFVLGLAFAFVNVSGEQISERMRKSGEYIYGVYPGQETSAYINHLVLRLGFIGALYGRCSDADYLGQSRLPAIEYDSWDVLDF